MNFENSLSFAQALDSKDTLRDFKNEFYCPQHNGESSIYFCGNSLGLQPKSIEKAIEYELKYWREHGVEGWFSGETPWLSYHKSLSELAAPIVGAKTEEVIIMNTLTVNLHLMLVSFYRPTQKRFKIVMEGGAFPSDQYAIETQLKFHGLDPSVALIELMPKAEEDCLNTENIIETIENEGDSIALVLLGGINYYTGQLYDMQAIAAAAHRVGAKVGFDLAHAAGNVLLNLHDWNADFAVWCTYKYLNSGPGGTSGVFVHERHFNDNSIPRFAGWWGHNEAERFKMEKDFMPMQGAAGWQISTPQIIPFAMHKASLEVFKKAGGMSILREKAIKLTAFLEFLLKQSSRNFKIITPSVYDDRGSQLSVLTDENGKKLFNFLAENGVICDWREPNVIRLAPVPLYNSFEEVWRVGNLMQ